VRRHRQINLIPVGTLYGRAPDVRQMKVETLAAEIHTGVQH